jgi:hypothetical protein
MMLTAVLLAACSPSTSSTSVQSPSTIAPTSAPLTGSVTINTPPDGAIIYSETVVVSGTAQNVPDNHFLVKLITAEDKTLAIVTANIDSGGNWSAEIVHGYAGEPTEVTISALPDYAGAPIDDDYAEGSIVISGRSYRPEGTYGGITAPLDGASVGGDTLQVSGTASGVFENQFTVELRSPDGKAISTQHVTLNNPNVIDEMPWETDLPTNGYLGPAEVRAYATSAKDGSEIPLGSAKITVTAAAG